MRNVVQRVGTIWFHTSMYDTIGRPVMSRSYKKHWVHTSIGTHTVKLVWSDPLWKDYSLERPFCKFWKFLSTIGFHADWTFLKRPPVWKDHFFLTFREVVPDRFHCTHKFTSVAYCYCTLPIHLLHPSCWQLHTMPFYTYKGTVFKYRNMHFQYHWSVTWAHLVKPVVQTTCTEQ